MGLCLAYYDVTGIQNYIFQSNELKNNTGASFLVYETLSNFLPKALKEVVKPSALVSDWINPVEFKLLDPNAGIQAEVIYIGGGNAMVAYAQKQVAVADNTQLSCIISEKALGLQCVSVIIEEEGKDFNEDRHKLVQALKEKKQSMPQNYKLMGLSIDELCPQTKLPVSVYINESQRLPNQITDINEGRFLPRETYLKRNFADNQEHYYSWLDINSDMYSLPLQFENLGSQDGESRIGVIHIDGNSMGKNIENIMKDISDYEQAIHRMRKLSHAIDVQYKNAMKTVLKAVEESCEKGKLGEIKLGQELASDKHYLPVRPLVINGDDITFVCDGRLALPLTELFLQEISKSTVKIDDDEFKLSACAGVAIVKTKFPFYRAYELAENCCKNAKKRAKWFANEYEQEVGSWLDFQVIFGGPKTELELHRISHYSTVDKIVQEFDGLKSFSLLWRPWRIGTLESLTDKEVKYAFEHFKTVMNCLLLGTDCKAWPRSKLKKLRSKYLEGKLSVKQFLSEMRSRGCLLPDITDFGGLDQLFKEGFDFALHTPYFDVIEVMDLWQPLKERVSGNE